MNTYRVLPCRAARLCILLVLGAGQLFGQDETSVPYRAKVFNTYDNSTLGWMMGNNAGMFGGVTPQAWTDGNATAANMSADLDVLRTLFTEKGYAGKNAMMVSDVDYQYSSTNGKVAAALFRIKNTTDSAINWSPSFYYSSNPGWGERAGVAINGQNVATLTSQGAASTDISIPANGTSTVLFTSTSAPMINGNVRGTQLGFRNDSLALPSGLSFVDDLDDDAIVPYRTKVFNTYDNSALGWMMGNNASMFGGVTPQAWTDGNATAANMSTDLDVLRAVFTEKGYGGKNAMIVSDVDYQYSSTNGKVAAALFRIRNTTDNAVTWSPSFYYSSNPGWGESAGVAINGQNVVTLTGYGATSTDISIPANGTSTVLFTSTSAPIGNGTVRGTQLGFRNDSLALPDGLSFVDDLDSDMTVPYRMKVFNTYDNSALGWMMGNNASMFGGVTPQAWTDGNATAANMSTDLDVLRALLNEKGYGGKNAMIVSDVDYQYSSTNGKVAAVMFLIENTTDSAITWSPSFYYSSNPGWGERAGVAINGQNVVLLTGYGATSTDISIPANGTSTVLFTSTSAQIGNGSTRGTQLGFFNNSLELPSGLRFIDDTVVPEPSTLVLLCLGAVCLCPRSATAEKLKLY